MKIELEPCPFCGGEARLYHESVWCNKCGGQTSEKPTKEAAIAAWNTRTAAKQEPVGYMNLYPDGRFSAAYESKEEAVKRRFDGHNTIPVYDHSIPAKYDEAKVDAAVAIDSMATAMCQSSFDWAADKYHAWLFGILIGWDEDSRKEFADRGVLQPIDIERMQGYRAALTALTEPAGEGRE